MALCGGHMDRTTVLACTIVAWKDMVTAPFCLPAACGWRKGCSALAMQTGHSAAQRAAAQPAFQCWHAKLAGECPQTGHCSLMRPWSDEDCRPHANHMQTYFWACVKHACRMGPSPASPWTVDCRSTTAKHLIQESARLRAVSKRQAS